MDEEKSVYKRRGECAVARKSSRGGRLGTAGPGEGVVTLAATEGALVCSLVLAVGASGDLRSPAVASKIPVDANWSVITGDESTVRALGPGWFTISEFDR